MLDPAIHYLNHGTVGATPRRVLRRQQELRDEMERQPAAFLLREATPMIRRADDEGAGRIRRAAEDVADFVGAEGDDLGFVVNVTAAVNAVLRSFAFAAGDEVVVFDHGYGAVINAARTITAASGARVVVANMPLAVSEDAVVAAFAAALTDHTRLAIIDHVTSGSALVLPVQRLVAAAHERGVAVLIDGAHAPGAIDVDVTAIDADFYAANLHKWAWAPRSCGFLWAKRERQRGLHAPIISWGVDEGLSAELDWQGTLDPTPMLAAPEGLAMLRELGVDAVRAHNHDLAWRAAATLASRWGTTFTTPRSMVGTMVTVPLPSSFGSTRADAVRLRNRLLDEHRIEVQVHEQTCADAVVRLHVRVSAQIYVDESDITALGAAVPACA